MIDILILTYNNLKTIDRCLAALEEHTSEKYNVHILDNGSTDQAFIEHLKGIKDNKISITFGEENTGVGPGRRFLSENTSAEFLMFLDSDMLVTHDWDKYMMRQFDKFPGTGAVCAKFRKGTEDITYANGGYYTVTGKYLLVHHYHTGLPIYDIRTYESISCQWIPGGVTMITNEANKHAKYLPTGFKVGLEDIDYSFQMKKAGFELYNCPYTDFFHLHEQKEKGYNNVRKDKMEFLLSSVLILERWHLNPIKSWDLDKLIFHKNLNDNQIRDIMNYAGKHKGNKMLIQQHIMETV